MVGSEGGILTCGSYEAFIYIEIPFIEGFYEIIK